MVELGASSRRVGGLDEQRTLPDRQISRPDDHCRAVVGVPDGPCGTGNARLANLPRRHSRRDCQSHSHSCTALTCPAHFCLASFEAFEADGKFFVNPGSATGAWSGLWNGWVAVRRERGRGLMGTTRSEATPSFALMDIQGPVVVTYVYQLVEGEVRRVMSLHEEVALTPAPARSRSTRSSTAGPTRRRSPRTRWVRRVRRACPRAWRRCP